MFNAKLNLQYIGQSFVIFATVLRKCFFLTHLQQFALLCLQYSREALSFQKTTNNFSHLSGDQKVSKSNYQRKQLWKAN